MRRRGTVILAVWALAALAGRAPLPACAGEPVRLGLNKTAGAAPLLAALDDGRFEREGLTLDLVDAFTGARAIEALAGGSVDITPVATLTVFQAADQGLDLVIVAPGSFMRGDDVAVNGLVVPASSNLATARDLRGRTIAINSLGGLNYLLTAAYLERGGVSADEVRWQEVAFSHMPAALEHGLVDAASMMEPYLTVLGAARIRVLSTGQEVLPHQSVACFVALRPWAESHRGELRAFSRAYAGGVELLRTQPGRVRALLANRLGLDPAVASRVALAEFRPTLEPADVRVLIELALRYGAIQRAPDLDRLLFAAGP